MLCSVRSLRVFRCFYGTYCYSNDQVEHCLCAQCVSYTCPEKFTVEYDDTAANLAYGRRPKLAEKKKKTLVPWVLLSGTFLIALYAMTTCPRESLEHKPRYSPLSDRSQRHPLYDWVPNAYDAHTHRQHERSGRYVRRF